MSRWIQCSSRCSLSSLIPLSRADPFMRAVVAGSCTPPFSLSLRVELASRRPRDVCSWVYALLDSEELREPFEPRSLDMRDRDLERRLLFYKTGVSFRRSFNISAQEFAAEDAHLLIDWDGKFPLLLVAICGACRRPNVGGIRRRSCTRHPSSRSKNVTSVRPDQLSPDSKKYVQIWRKI